MKQPLPFAFSHVSSMPDKKSDYYYPVPYKNTRRRCSCSIITHDHDENKEKGYYLSLNVHNKSTYTPSDTGRR